MWEELPNSSQSVVVPVWDRCQLQDLSAESTSDAAVHGGVEAARSTEWTRSTSPAESQYLGNKATRQTVTSSSRFIVPLQRFG